MRTEANDRTTLRQRLLALLEAEQAQVVLFIELLEEERGVLDGRDVEPLFALAERKATLARTLQQFADKRTAILMQAALPGDRAGIEALLGDARHPAWLGYLERVQAARNLNEDNGIRITERLSSNHQALAVLNSLSEHPATYGPDGQASSRPGSRLFGSV